MEAVVLWYRDISPISGLHGIRKNDIIFQQDNNSKHIATNTKVWFYYNEIDDLDELWEVIQKVWAEIDMDYLNKLIDSIPQ
ncbi:30036_t:CDS:2 [Gigaspora margarita]|uniref:30036_t:CDS:1 n=1 Tax=Gigaspora margarita TaxID=4874 RepID=A0ABN7WIH8_GIGMA|nr:30036_t:CDS:2 [Gigaspora margarita]